MPDLPNTYLVGESRPNYEAHLPELGLDEARYDAVLPAEGVTTDQFVARRTAPPRDAAAVDPAFKLPDGFSLVPRGGLSERGIPLRIRCNRDGAEMAWVQPGVFLQGTDAGPSECGPRHPTYLDGYYIDVHEVTVAQYEKFHSGNSSRRPQQPLNQFDPPQTPALGVTWRDALNYVKWAGKELPTEAEWEKAARGEHGFEYPWGNGRPLWGKPRDPGQIDPVGTFAADRSVYGVMDLAGNAREWCGDWYAVDAYSQSRTKDGSAVRNPEGPDRPTTPNVRVVKGAGSAGWSLWSRGGVNMKDSQYDVSFRGVLRIKLPEPADGSNL